MGEFGRIDWLGNFRVIIFYNVWFEVATAFCLFSKFTATVRNALFEPSNTSSVAFLTKVEK